MYHWNNIHAARNWFEIIKKKNIGENAPHFAVRMMKKWYEELRMH